MTREVLAEAYKKTAIRTRSSAYPSFLKILNPMPKPMPIFSKIAMHVFSTLQAIIFPGISLNVDPGLFVPGPVQQECETKKDLSDYGTDRLVVFQQFLLLRRMYAPLGGPHHTYTGPGQLL